MKRLAMYGTPVLIAAALGLAAPHRANARMQYFKAFESAYPKVEGVGDAKCGICHGGNNGANKKILSKYATELKDALGGKNVKEMEKIEKALKTAAEKEYEPGKSYDGLLKDGKLPPKAEE